MKLISRFMPAAWSTKPVEYTNNPEGAYITDCVVWVIFERKWIFFRKILTHTKIVKSGHPDTEDIRYPDVMLTFPVEEAAEDEIDRLGFGQNRVTERVWQGGGIMEEHYE